MKYNLITLICLAGLASAIPVEGQQEIPELSCEPEPPAPSQPPAPPAPTRPALELPNCDKGAVLLEGKCVIPDSGAEEEPVDGDCVEQGEAEDWANFINPREEYLVMGN
ncbi:hypothetical protein MY8738_005350 [Beauveria namnaoensis]